MTKQHLESANAIPANLDDIKHLEEVKSQNIS